MNPDASEKKTKPWAPLDVAALEDKLRWFLIGHGWKEEVMVVNSNDVRVYYKSPLTGHLHPLSFAVGCVFGEYGIKA